MNDVQAGNVTTFLSLGHYKCDGGDFINLSSLGVCSNHAKTRRYEHNNFILLLLYSFCIPFTFCHLSVYSIFIYSFKKCHVLYIHDHEHVSTCVVYVHLPDHVCLCPFTINYPHSVLVNSAVLYVIVCVTYHVDVCIMYL